tara:strand:- start:435 stop:629 length:195 start_codon:yes stop_codon:yes gene_type:complete
LQILTHYTQFFDTLLVHGSKMIKKLLKLLTHSKESSYIDAKVWIQKILLEERYKKDKFLSSLNT